MKTKTFLLLSLLLAGAVDARAGGAVTARTDAFRLDLRPSPRVVAAGATESLAYSTRWDGGDAAAIALDGEAFGSYAGEGTANWTPSASGLYAFTHSGSLGGVAVGEMLTASFLVEGADASDLTILATSDLKEGTGIALGGVPAGWTLHYTTDGSAPTAASPEYTGPFTLAQSATVKVVAVSPGGFVSDVAERRFDLAPPLAVTGAQARQRYPWNGLVDVDFTLEGDPVCTYRVALVARDVDGGTNLAVRTVWEDRGAVTNDAVDLRPGVHRLVWNAAADLPEGFAADRVAIGVRADSVQDTALYMVVDLSGGPDAKRYPVSYLPDVPEGGWTDEYKTDKLVLRRIEPGKGETCGEPMFAAVFETTQGQFENVTGTNTSEVSLLGDGRPVGITYSDIDQTQFPVAIRSKTGLYGFDLPSTNQWIYVCRANTVSSLNNGKSISDSFISPEADGIARYAGNSGWRFSSDQGATVPYQTWDGLGAYDRAAVVGAYIPNSWGVFDMHGNNWEWCSGFDNGKVVAKGGAWNSYAYSLDPNNELWRDPNSIKLGFRLFLHNAPAVIEAPIVAPAELTATTNQTGDVTLSWEPVAGAYAYQIRRSKTGAFEDGTWLNTVTNTAYADWTAESRADYAYWVRAQFESGRVGEWSEVAEGCRHKYYSVHFNANGGTGTMVDLELRFDQPQALTANAFTKSGNVFAGWATTAGGSALYADGETVENLSLEPGAVVTLYACWATSSYTVKFNKNASAATGSMADQTMARNASAALRANAFVRAGYKFAGWATSASGAKVYDDKQSVKNITTGSSITLYAVWEALTAQTALYMVIDLSGGSSASSYPVSYLAEVPSGGWTDTYKTTKLVLRRCEAGTFKYQGTTTTTISKAFFISIFEITQKQWGQVTGNSQKTYYNTGDTYPANGMVNANDILPALRSRTGFSGINLPTEIQWEYACKAGTTTELNSGKPSTAQNMLEVGCCYDDYHVGGVKVGLYKPNAWGLYDMHGNVFEWCLNGSSLVKRGGGWNYRYRYCTSENRDFSNPSYNSYGNDYYGGIRIVVNFN